MQVWFMLWYIISVYQSSPICGQILYNIANSDACQCILYGILYPSYFSYSTDNPY